MARQIFEWDYTNYPGAKKYPHVFSPIQLGNLIIPNRVKYAATEDNLNSHDGYITDEDVAYMRERARGVAGGLCTMQGVYMDERRYGQGYVGQAAAWDDKFIPGLKRIADAIHEERAVANFQLMHCGRVGGVETPFCEGPSFLPQRLRLFKPVHEMSHEEVEISIQQHIDAARRGIEAGFDVMEISGIVGYLVSNFLSSYTNRRTDEYGGDIYARCKFMTDIIKGVRGAIGPDIPLIIRICAWEQLDDVGGNTQDESMIVYQEAVKAGVDSISVTVGWQESIVPVISRDIDFGTWLWVPENAKKFVDVPLSMAYRLFHADMADKAIADGKIDYWENCRPQIADPDMPLKYLEGREEDIRWCVACNVCLARLFRDAPMTCYINPTCAHENDPSYYPQPASTKKTVFIAGGGPAGLECAWVAADRGHEVHVYDDREKLGGTIIDAGLAPYNDDELYRIIEFHKAQCDKRGVEFHIGEKLTAEILEEELPDTVVIATGADYLRGNGAPGFDRDNVISLTEALYETKPVGDRVVVWGNRKPGIGCALALAKKGKKVTLVGAERTVGKDINPSFRWRYNMFLRQNGVTSYNDCDIAEIEDGRVIIMTYDGHRVPVEADTVVYAERGPSAFAAELKAAAAEESIETYVIGDAVVPRGLSGAVHDGYKIGLRI
ncbi:MAG: FAD-dependent oxidoreductase [Actinobacteria bacterium]|nr:FAD-dependent oxidoreductase [Actinomycetota bacterium]